MLSIINFDNNNAKKLLIKQLHFFLLITQSKQIIHNISTIIFKMLVSDIIGEGRQPWAGVCLRPIVFFQKV